MDIAGEYRIAAPREVVWGALNDPDVLKQCIPGCQELDQRSPTEFAAKVSVKLGPIAANFTGAVTLENINAPAGYTIVGQGQGGAAGFAKGRADVALTEEGPDETLLRYTAKADVGGKLATLGGRLIQATSKKMADEFFGKFASLLGGEPAAGTAAPPEKKGLWSRWLGRK
jgi:carbon monoxide dehydrogenase subunit G